MLFETSFFHCLLPLGEGKGRGLESAKPSSPTLLPKGEGSQTGFASCSCLLSTSLHICADFLLPRTRSPRRLDRPHRRSQPTVERQLARPPCRLPPHPTAGLP